MSSDTSELIRRHFSALEEEDEEFTSSHSRTHSQLPGQLEAEEAKELEALIDEDLRKDTGSSVSGLYDLCG